MRIRSPWTVQQMQPLFISNIFIGIDDEIIVDADLAELIDDDGEALAVRFGEDSIEQGRLAGTRDSR